MPAHSIVTLGSASGTPPSLPARRATPRRQDSTYSSRPGSPEHAHVAKKAEIDGSASRRQCLQLLSAAAAVAAVSTRPAPAAAEAAALTPYQRGLALEYGLAPDGRIRSCPTDANPNCVSTASTNATYMPAWEAPQGSPADAMLQFTAALAAVAPEVQVVESASSPTSEYRRFVVNDALFERDDIEVLISQQRPPYELEPPLVTFRSMAAKVRYIWPIIQPISDLGAQRKRLKEVRLRLGWRLLGCDLLECYEE